MLVGVDLAADDVLRVGRGRRRGTGLGDAEELVVLQGDPHDEVRERQVREELPLRDDQLEVVDGGAGELGVLGQQVRERAQNSSMRNWWAKQF
ncbi:hypothetical protein GCM10017774_85710 [Lentzea cavernae]|uniref:Uncharacterized protein n=1 Tax=Lentzea cavernae TaxID=2020703 RepID=A0ABQ3MWQ4_9PSEU|nr:hypothetical protein GCM10017774_85710 [Lentzea cavernae]